jgi:hypothetical protein
MGTCASSLTLALLLLLLLALLLCHGRKHS